MTFNQCICSIPLVTCLHIHPWDTYNSRHCSGGQAYKDSHRSSTWHWNPLDRFKYVRFYLTETWHVPYTKSSLQHIGKGIWLQKPREQGLVNSRHEVSRCVQWQPMCWCWERSFNYKERCFWPSSPSPRAPCPDLYILYLSELVSWEETHSLPGIPLSFIPSSTELFPKHIWFNHFFT